MCFFQQNKQLNNFHRIEKWTFGNYNIDSLLFELERIIILINPTNYIQKNNNLHYYC